MLNDPSPPPPLLYYNNIERDNGTAPWQEEGLIRSLSLGMKDQLDHPAVIFASYSFPEEAGGKQKSYPEGLFPSKQAQQQQTHLHRAWLGCWQWGLGTIKGCMGLGIAWGASSTLPLGWEFRELFKDLRQALKPLSLPCISGVNCTPGSGWGKPLQSPPVAQRMVMPL